MTTKECFNILIKCFTSVRIITIIQTRGITFLPSSGIAFLSYFGFSDAGAFKITNHEGLFVSIASKANYPNVVRSHLVNCNERTKSNKNNHLKKGRKEESQVQKYILTNIKAKQDSMQLCRACILLRIHVCSLLFAAPRLFHIILILSFPIRSLSSYFSLLLSFYICFYPTRSSYTS